MNGPIYSSSFRRNRVSRTNSKTRTYGYLIGIGLAVLLLAGGCFAIAQHYYKTREVTFTVQDKAIKNHCDNGDCSSIYMIYTDHGVFEDKDTMVHFKFNSSDIYGNLKRNHTYTCKVYGWRSHLNSQYPNIVSCKDAS